VKQIMENGQRRAEELEAQTRHFYTEVLPNDPDYKAAGLDLKTISYIPSPDGRELIPVAQKFEQ
jgi:hypothetical protein